MIRLTEIKLPIELAPSLIHQSDEIKAAILKKLGIPENELIRFEIFKRGLDARKSHTILYVYSIDAEVKNEARLLAKFRKDPHIKLTPDTEYKYVVNAPVKVKERPVVVGFGPAGIFAALILAQSGLKPIVLERGKAVRERTKDTWGLWRKSKLNPESNVQFGEGGAGTFSDGKLYSQIKDPKHYGRKVLQEFVKAGAPEEILYVSHPHIGTFRLVGMVEEMRNTIIALGGEIRFQSRVEDIEIKNGEVRGVMLQSGEHITTRHLVLAVGHSARDTFEM
ncbi:MAG: FAD-dependent oxidoreductase, partial [Nitrosomonadales bacterium]|nr:FAD-dependent oxidoreductase [Nitrosomonadales bacterium]